MAKNPEKLTCISIIVCDDIYRDEQTKKLILVGTFNSITAPSLPCRHKRMSVLFTLTNARGTYDLSLSIEHVKTEQKVVEFAGPFRADDPLAIHEVHVTLENAVFPEEGKYWVSLSADGEIIQQRPLWMHASGPTAPRAREDDE